MIAAVAQLRSTSNKYQNLKDIAHCAKLAKEQDACILFLPECFGFLGESAIQTLEEAEPYDRFLSMLTSNKNEETKSSSSSGGFSIATSNNDESVAHMIQETIFPSTAESNNHLTNVHTSPVGQDQQSKVTAISLLEGLQTIAQLSGLWISGGGMHIQAISPETEATSSPQSSPKVFNTHVIIDPNGRLRAHYHKIHLFDVDNIPSGQSQQQMVSLQESATTVPGTEYVICPDTPLGTLGLSICYDVRFPEQYTTLRKMGANVLLVPSAFTVPTGQAGHWHVLLQARAIETQCYVIAAAQYGQHNHKRTSFGHALVVDPWGAILADAGGYHDRYHDNHGPSSTSVPPPPPSIITAPIDLDYVQQIRQRMPIETHRANAVTADVAVSDTTIGLSK
jgi:deaminated glutathione amidase